MKIPPFRAWPGLSCLFALAMGSSCPQPPFWLWKRSYRSKFGPYFYHISNHSKLLDRPHLNHIFPKNVFQTTKSPWQWKGPARKTGSHGKGNLHRDRRHSRWVTQTQAAPNCCLPWVKTCRPPWWMPHRHRLPQRNSWPQASCRQDSPQLKLGTDHVSLRFGCNNVFPWAPCFTRYNSTSKHFTYFRWKMIIAQSKVAIGDLSYFINITRIKFLTK